VTFYDYTFPENLKFTNKVLVDFLRSMYAQEIPVQFKWEGGSDSGAAYVVIDGTRYGYTFGILSIQDEIVNNLLDLIFNELDYGSWAGDFSANGTADLKVNNEGHVYFKGTDFYTEEVSHVAELNYHLKIPAELLKTHKVTELFLNISGGYDGHLPEVHFNGRIDEQYKGYVLQDIPEIETICNDIAVSVNEIMTEFDADNVYESVVIPINESGEVDFIVEDFTYYVKDESEKIVYVEIESEL